MKIWNSPRACVSFGIILLGILPGCGRTSIDGPAGATPPIPRTADTGATLLFSTGFETDTKVALTPPFKTNDDYQYFSGTDHLTGFVWPMSFWGASRSVTGIHAITGAGNKVADYINNTLEIVSGPLGSATQALKMQISGPAPGFCCAQSMFQISGMTQQVTDVYARYWLKLNPEFAGQVRTNGANFWRTVLELKTRTDYRISTFIVGNRNGLPSWRVIVDNNPNGIRTNCPNNACWSIDNSAVAVPLDSWFLIEVYLHRSAGQDGRFFWAVNGQALIDHYGPSFGANQENIDFLAFSALYGDARNLTPASQWIDDLEVWDYPPCGNLPCGNGPAVAAQRAARPFAALPARTPGQFWILRPMFQKHQ